jgi:hypothetical protein
VASHSKVEVSSLVRADKDRATVWKDHKRHNQLQHISCKRGESETTTEKAGGHEKAKTHNEEKERAYLCICLVVITTACKYRITRTCGHLLTVPFLNRERKTKRRTSPTYLRCPVASEMHLQGPSHWLQPQVSRHKSRGRIFHQSFRQIEVSVCERGCVRIMTTMPSYFVPP